jgi:hypothetical protein
MNLQGRDLRLGLTVDDVRLLHTELTLLNFPIPDNERYGGLFGPATFAAVQQCQALFSHPLGPIGVVNAKAIKDRVDAQFPPVSAVSGQVYSAQRSGVDGLHTQVIANHKQGASAASLSPIGQVCQNPSIKGRDPEHRAVSINS